MLEENDYCIIMSCCSSASYLVDGSKPRTGHLDSNAGEREQTSVPKRKPSLASVSPPMYV